MNEGPNLVLELVQILASLAVVLGLVWILLRFGLPRLLGHGRARGVPIEVLGVRPLDRQVKLAVVVAEGRRFLLAFGPGGITTLASRAVDEPGPTADPSVGRGRSPEDGGEGRTPS